MKRKKILPLLAGVVLAVSLFPAAAAMEQSSSANDCGSGDVYASSAESGTEKRQTEESENGNIEDTVLYNGQNGYVYVISGLEGTLRCVTADRLQTEPVSSAEGDAQTEKPGCEIDVELLSQSKDADFVYGDITASALSPDNTILAVALCHMDPGKQGRVVLFQCRNDGSLQYLSMVTTGISPGMILFDDDSSLILTADRGCRGFADSTFAENGEEQTADLYNKGRGSVTAIDITAVRQTASPQDNMPGFSSGAAVITDFSAFDDPGIRGKLLKAHIIGERDGAPSEEFIPQCIAVAGEEAYVTLKGIDAVALFDLGEKRFTGILPTDPAVAGKTAETA